MRARAAVLPTSRPLSLQRPVGTSMATRAPGCPWWRRVSRLARESSIGRCWPTPKRPSIQRAPSMGSGCPSSTGIPSQRQWRRWALVSGLGRSKGVQRRTGTPARCSSRATTSPSPPLWPGPTSTRAAAGGVASSRRAIARAAFSIRASTGRPLVNSWLSSSAIWVPVTSRWSASAAGQVGQGLAATGSGTGTSRGLDVAIGGLAVIGPAQFHDGIKSRPVCPKAGEPPLWPVFPHPPSPLLPVRPLRPHRPGRRRLSGCGLGQACGGWRWDSRVGWTVP